MDFEEFEARASAEWERIPAEYRAGVDGLVVKRPARRHPSQPDVFTMGECITEAYPSDFGGPDTVRSLVVLWYGSFFRLSRIDPEFDWEGELWETLTHELQHHLESLAADDALVDMDYAADENFKRYDGEPFDPFFYRHGMPEGGWLRVDDEFFLEITASPGTALTFEWEDAQYEITAPAEAFDIAIIRLTSGVDDATGPLHVVVVRPAGGWRERLSSLWRRSPPQVLELDDVARPRLA
jgi:hypothetical protein